MQKERNKATEMELGEIIESKLAEIDTIEIVPAYLIPENQPWCLINGVFGVTNKFLAKSFLKICPYDPQNLTNSQALLILLATTENAVAVNRRKRMCQTNEIDPRNELHLITVILKSHLYKHCKSSWLWYHRRWLLENFKLDSSLDDEWHVIELAAQHHPKNYYAWGYLRWFYESKLKDQPNQQQRLADLVKSLCYKNLSDVSMWSFLHWLCQPELTKFAIDTSNSFQGHHAVLAAVSLPRNKQMSIQ